MPLPSSRLLSEPLPPSVDDVLANREQIYQQYPPKGFAKWRVSRNTWKWISSHDTPSASFYRLYQFVIIGWSLQFRNELEYFCTSHPALAVSDLPDPMDTDPAWYAFLAGLTYLICEALNRRIELGLPRDAPAIVIDWDELQNRPKVLEDVPKWATCVPPLTQPLRLPDEEGRFVDADDPEAYPAMKRFNIIMPYPHIHFV